MNTTINLTSGIFDTARVHSAGSKAVMDSAREERDRVKQSYKEPKSGILYAKRGGAGFRRSHRASAKGEAPAVDTGKQLNATEANRLGDLTAETVVKTDYAPILQGKLGRPIMNEDTAAKAHLKLNANYEKELAKLV